MTDEQDPQQEPAPGSTEWLLAQLSGGRLDSRRERREAQAELEARGVQFDLTTGAITLPELPGAPEGGDQQADVAEPSVAQADVEQAAPDAAPSASAVTDAGADAAPAEHVPATDADADAPVDERPKARFSWETGTLQAVAGTGPEAGTAPDAVWAAASPAAASPAAGDDAPAAADDSDDEPPTAASSVAPRPVPAASGPRREPPLWFDAPDAPPLSFESTFTAPAPKSPTDADDEQAFRWNLSPTVDADPAVNPRLEVPEQPKPTVPPVIPAAVPLIAPKPISWADASPQAPAATPAEPVAAPTPLPPGTTAHEFDPFAQDLFAPDGAAGTPVPSVDEFTMPDEGREAQASVPTEAISVPTEAMSLPTQAMPTQPGTQAVPTQPGDATGEHVSSDWTDIADMLGAQPETVENSIVPEWPPPDGTFDGFAQAVAPAADALAQAVAPGAVARQAADRPDSAPVEHRRRLPVNRWLIVAAAVLVLVLVAVLLFAIGRAVANGRNASAAAAASANAAARTSSKPSVTPTPTPTPSNTPVVPPTGTLPAGQTYQWDQLRGGECINPFGGAWAQQYAVVGCTTAHSAQLVYTAPYTTNPSAAFPGEQAIASQMNLLCSKPGVVDMSAAASYTDMQLVESYPVTSAQWAAGQRNYYCFVTRSSGQPMTSSVQGPGPQ